MTTPTKIITAKPTTRKKKPGEDPLADRLMRPGEFGLWLKSTREKAGYSRLLAGRKLGLLTGQNVYNWESEASPLPRKHLPRLASIYKISFEMLRTKRKLFERSRIENKYKGLKDK